MGWNVYQYCLKKKTSVTLYELEGPKSHNGHQDQNALGILSQPEWIFVFERVGALTGKGKTEPVTPGVKHIANAFTVYTLKNRADHADVIYTLDLRYPRIVLSSFAGWC
jgi:hypothetical protein